MKKDILKEIACYAGCIVFIGVSGYFAGFFKDLSYQGFSNTVIANVKSTGIEQYINQERSPRKKSAVYKNYRPRIIPESVLKGSESSNTWTNVFNNDKKVVFYITDGKDDFDSSIQSYVSKTNLNKNYTFSLYTQDAFNNMRTGTIGPSKICNGFEECNKLRENASNYTLLTSFLSNCGRTMCIIKPSQKQYIQLKTRSAEDAKKMLEGLKNW
jgi:hypothetical protein